MRLISYDGFELKVADEALLIRPIRELFEADRSKRKEQFLRQMSYLYFMTDPRSTLMYVTDEEERSREVRLQEGFPDGWEPDARLRAAMERYRAHTVTTSSLVLQSMRKSIDNLRRFLEQVDLLAVDDRGKPLYQVAAITTAIKQVPEISRALAEAERALERDFADADMKARGSRELSPFEDNL